MVIRRSHLIFCNSVIAILAALFLSSAAMARENLLSEPDQQAVQQVIVGQISAFKTDDYSAAYSFAAPNVRQVFPSVQVFIDMVRSQYMPLYRPASYLFGRNTQSEGRVYQELIVTDLNRQLWQVIYTLRQQDDKTWKVTNVVMYPYDGVSA
ncbi:DUF4864 domain-containing protein [Porticoccus sp.]|uniref:DUF4864 domain-containing protein n=1 Tax=Porticoccus sp. TaxID=2024853 RepID=UPI003F69FACB